jgi:hypothetical protein
LNTILCCGDYLYKEIYKTFTRWLFTPIKYTMPFAVWTFCFWI